jgi:hypothetical protein
MILSSLSNSLLQLYHMSVLGTSGNYLREGGATDTLPIVAVVVLLWSELSILPM